MTGSRFCVMLAATGSFALGAVGASFVCYYRQPPTPERLPAEILVNRKRVVLDVYKLAWGTVLIQMEPTSYVLFPEMGRVGLIDDVGVFKRRKLQLGQLGYNPEGIEPLRDYASGLQITRRGYRFKTLHGDDIEVLLDRP